MYRLYNSELLALGLDRQPIGLGVRSVGEYANFYTGEFFDKSLVRKLAGFLQAGETVVTAFRQRGLGVLPVAVAAGVKGAVSTAGIISKISGLVSGVRKRKLAARRAKNSKRGWGRAEGYLKTAQAEVERLAAGLVRLKMPIPAQAGDAYYAQLLKRIGRTKPNQRKYGKRSQRDPFSRFIALLRETANQVEGIVDAVSRAAAPAPPSGPISVPVPATPAPAPEVKKYEYTGAARPLPEKPLVEEGRVPSAPQREKLPTEYEKTPPPKKTGLALLGVPLALGLAAKFLGGR